MTGAGISVGGGIPDFRSMNGMYNLVKQKYPDAVVKGRDIFDANLFRDAASIRVFYSFMAELKSIVDAATCTGSHELIQRIKERKRLVRCYTQNIDGMESQLGLNCDMNNSKADVVMLHGAISHVICTICKHRTEFTIEHQEVFAEGTPTECDKCALASELRVASNKRSLPVGVMRPDIILYNEHH